MVTKREEILAEAGRGGAIALGPRTRLRFTGADRVRFLNGQLSTDIRSLAPGEIRPALVLTAKGKLCAVVFVSAEPDALVIDADATLRESLPARFDRYIVADDVCMDDISVAEAGFHIFGAAAEGIDSPRLMRIRGMNGVDGDALPDGVRVWTLAEVDALEIATRTARWGAELDGDTLPQEADLEVTHVDFHKGCYVGQEVVSRLKSVGHVNRHVITCAADVPLLPNAALLTPSGSPVGRITRVAEAFGVDGRLALGIARSHNERLTAVAPDGHLLGEVIVIE